MPEKTSLFLPSYPNSILIFSPGLYSFPELISKSCLLGSPSVKDMLAWGILLTSEYVSKETKGPCDEYVFDPTLIV